MSPPARREATYDDLLVRDDGELAALVFTADESQDVRTPRARRPSCGRLRCGVLHLVLGHSRGGNSRIVDESSDRGERRSSRRPSAPPPFGPGKPLPEPTPS